MLLFEVADVEEKLARVDLDIETALAGRASRRVPVRPARAIDVRPSAEHPKKEKIATREGQARLLHDLASIELQALELAMRTLVEFPDADPVFRHELALVARGEGQHLRLCLDGIQELGFAWGRWPVHTALWEATAPEDSLLDRILIVHRYLEGAGLDASESIRRRLSGIRTETVVDRALDVIGREEIDHVKFGSDWYRRECRREGLDPVDDFGPRLEGLLLRLPRRLEALAEGPRRQAGFEEAEITWLKNLRERILAAGGHPSRITK